MMCLHRFLTLFDSVLPLFDISAPSYTFFYNFNHIFFSSRISVWFFYISNLSVKPLMNCFPDFIKLFFYLFYSLLNFLKTHFFFFFLEKSQIQISWYLLLENYYVLWFFLLGNAKCSNLCTFFQSCTVTQLCSQSNYADYCVICKVMLSPPLGAHVVR